jgi:hypothetical protein
MLFLILVISPTSTMNALGGNDDRTVEGVWVCIYAEPHDAMRLLNQTLTISRKDGGYVAQWLGDPPSSWIYSGNDTQIVHSEMLPVGGPNMPDQLLRNLGDTQFRHSFSYVLVGDGRSLEMVEEGVEISWDRNWKYYIKPAKAVWTLKRIFGPPSGEKSNVASSKNTSIDAGPSREEIAVKQRQEAHTLNEQGVQHWKNKQYQQAADAFKAALDKSPDDPIIRKNYEDASAALRVEMAERQRQEQAAMAPQNTRVGPADTAPSAGADAHTALDQANTSNKETRQGLESGKPELMKEQSNKVLDNPVPLQPSGISPAEDLRNVGKESGWPAFVRNDKEIIQMQKNRDAFLATQQMKGAELTEARKQIEAETDSTKKGDLMVKAAMIKADGADAEYKAAVLDKDMQKRAKLLIDTHVEEPPPVPGEQKTPSPNVSKTGE